MSLAHVCRSAYARTTLLALVCALSDSSSGSASAMFTAPPPTAPGDSGGTSVSPWIPVNDQPAGSNGDGCGDWLWFPYRVSMTTPAVSATAVPFTPSMPGTGTRRLELSRDRMSLVGSYQLENLWVGPMCVNCGTTDDAPTVTGSAERPGLLYWFPSISPTGGALLGQPTRLRIVSRAMLKGRIDLDYGIVLAGETSRLAIGGFQVSVRTVGDPIHQKIDEAVAQSPALAKVNPNAVHASSAQQSSLGLGVTIGADNGGSGEVSWTAGGSQAWIELNESMKCVEFACVTPAGASEWYFAQEADMLIDAALIYGRHAKVDVTCEFQDFHFETMGCPSCTGLSETRPGPQTTGGQQ